MAKQPSKRLCELCELKSKIIYSPSRIFSNSTEVDLSFERPENLFKLMNLEFSYNSKKTRLMKFLNYKLDGLWLEKPEDFIKYVIGVLEAPMRYNTCENVASNIKQAIKNTQWEY